MPRHDLVGVLLTKRYAIYAGSFSICRLCHDSEGILVGSKDASASGIYRHFLTEHEGIIELLALSE